MANVERWSGPILTTYQDYLDELCFIRKAKFRLLRTCTLIPHNEYEGVFVYAYTVSFVSASTSEWHPASVLYQELGKPLNLPWCDSIMALQRMGLSETMAEQIVEADRESIFHRSVLRQQILESLNLPEYPHAEREWVMQGHTIKLEGKQCLRKSASKIKLVRRLVN